MGSLSDKAVLAPAAALLDDMKVGYEWKVVSAHRTPEDMLLYAKEAQSRGLQLIIAAAGGAAHLPGMVAAATPLPVIGVPVRSTHSLAGLDSMLSIAQMPAGVPVATMALDGGYNAALFALKILALHDSTLAKRLIAHTEQQKHRVAMQNKELASQHPQNQSSVG